MTISSLLNNLQTSIRQWVIRQQQIRQQRLRVVRLEDRRLPDASFALAAASLVVDGFDAGDSLDVSFDASAGAGSERFLLQLNSGSWDVADLVGGPFALSPDLKTLTVGTSALSELVINGAGGLSAVTQSTALSIASLHVSDVDHVTLNAGANDFDHINISAQSLLLSDADDLTIDSLHTAGSASLSATTQIHDVAGSVIHADGHLNLQAAEIVLGDSPADDVRMGSLEFHSSGRTTVNTDSHLLLSHASSADSFELASDTGISNLAGTTLHAAHHAHFKAPSVMVGFGAGDDVRLGNVSFDATGSFNLCETDGIMLSGTSHAQEVYLKTPASITDDAGVDLSVTGKLDLRADSVLLGDDVSDDIQIGRLHFSADHDVTLTADDLLLSPGSIARNIHLTSHQHIESDPGSVNILTGDRIELDAGTSIGNSAQSLILKTDRLDIHSGTDQFLKLTQSVTLESLISDTGSIHLMAPELLDGNADAVNLSARHGQVDLDITSRIGAAPADFFKPGALDAVEIRAASVSIQAGGNVAVHLMDSTSFTHLQAPEIWCTGAADIDLSHAVISAQSLAMITPTGLLTLPGLLTVPADLRIEARDIASSIASPELQSSRLLLKCGSAETLTIRTSQLDAAGAGNLSFTNRAAHLELADLDCDLHAILTPTAITEISTAPASSLVSQDLPSSSTQNSAILTSGLALKGPAEYQLDNPENQIGTLAAQISGRLTLAERDGVVIGSLNSVTGIHTDGADILMSLGGSSEIRSDVNSGTADIRILVAGDLNQTGGQIYADEFGIRQTLTTGGNVHLLMDNDVTTFAALNSAAGDLRFGDANDLVIGDISTQQRGTVRFDAISGLNSQGGSIQITTDGDLRILRNVRTGDGVEDTTLASGETIELRSIDGNIILDGVGQPLVISTDENLLRSNPETGDQIIIEADPDRSYTEDLDSDGILDNDDPDIDGDGILNHIDVSPGSISEGLVQITGDVTVRTDGGVGRLFGPRPEVGQSGTAFFQYVTNPLPLAIDNSNAAWNGSAAYIDAFHVEIGVAGEENLQVLLDWQDPANETRVLLDATTQQIAAGLGLDNPMSSERIQSFLMEQGGQPRIIGHLYTALDMTLFQTRLHQTTIIVDLSVSQHPSIHVAGAFIEQDRLTDPTDGRAVSSTDNPLTGSAQFEGATALFRIPTLTPAPAALFVAQPTAMTERPSIPAPPDSRSLFESNTIADFGGGAATGSAFATDVFFQIRRQFETDQPAEVVIERISDASLISSREAFEQFVQRTPELQDGAGYEIWLISETAGQRVERPIVEFEITGGSPGPASSDAAATNEPDHLMDVPFEKPETPVEDATQSMKDPESEESVPNAAVPNVSTTFQAPIPVVDVTHETPPELPDDSDETGLTRIVPRLPQVGAVAGLAVLRFRHRFQRNLPRTETTPAHNARPFQGESVPNPVSTETKP